MIRPYHLAVVLTLLSVVSSAPAFAETDQEKAATLYKQGIDLYFAEDYGLAITKFRSGYQLDPNPMFLYSLSLCFHKLGNLPDALDQAERADAAGGMTPRDTTSNQARIFAYKVGIKTEVVAKNVANRPPPGACVSNADCKTTGEICNIATKQCVMESRPDTSAGGMSLGPIGYAGIGAAAVGVGLLVGGGVTSLSVKNKEEELATLGAGDQQRVDDLVTELNKQKNLGKFFVIGGAGMLAVGAGLFVVDLFVLKKDEGATSAFVPMLLPDGGGIGWTTQLR